MDYGRSVRLGKVMKRSTEEAASVKRLNKFLKNKNKKKRREALRDTRLKLNKLTRKDIGK